QVRPVVLHGRRELLLSLGERSLLRDGGRAEQVRQLGRGGRAVVEADRGQEELRRVLVVELVRVDRHVPRQRLLGGERVAGEDRVGADRAERDRRAGIVAERILRRYLARHGRGHAERGGDHGLV